MSRNRTIALILAISAILSQANAATFQGVGGLSDHVFMISECWGVSGDGSVAFGSSRSSDGREAFRWTAQTDIGSLGDLPGGQIGGYAFDSSYDGSVIVGHSRTNTSSGQPVEKAYVWTQETGVQELPLPDDPYFSYFPTDACAVSADGLTIVGLVGGTIFGPYPHQESMIWNLQDNTVTLMDRPNGSSPFFQPYEVDISADGSTILVIGSPEYFLWTQEHGYTETVSGAMSLSGDGSTILGSARVRDELSYEISYDTFVWTEQSGHQHLGTVDGWISNQGGDISYDGSTVVGHLLNDPMQYEDFAAYIWNEQDGVRLIQDILANDYNLDLAGWTLTNATGISDDCLTIVGNGINPDGAEEGWIATIPEPATIILLALGAVALRRQNRGQLPI